MTCNLKEMLIGVYLFKYTCLFKDTHTHTHTHTHTSLQTSRKEVVSVSCMSWVASVASVRECAWVREDVLHVLVVSMSCMSWVASVAWVRECELHVLSCISCMSSWVWVACLELHQLVRVHEFVRMCCMSWVVWVGECAWVWVAWVRDDVLHVLVVSTSWTSWCFASIHLHTHSLSLSLTHNTDTQTSLKRCQKELLIGQAPSR